MNTDETLTASPVPPVPAFALTYAVSAESPAEAEPQRRAPRRHLRWAAIGIGIQVALAALVGVVALPFIEPLHSE